MNCTTAFDRPIWIGFPWEVNLVFPEGFFVDDAETLAIDFRAKASDPAPITPSILRDGDIVTLSLADDATALLAAGTIYGDLVLVYADASLAPLNARLSIPVYTISTRPTQ